MEFWSKSGAEGGRKQQVVGQAELFPCVVAKEIWKSKMKSRLVLLYTDTEPVRYGLIRATSPVQDSVQMIQGFWEAEYVDREGHL